MDRGQPEQPERPYRGRRGGANRRVQVFYNAQDLASGAIRRLVRIQGATPNFIIPRRTYDQNDPHVALIVNADWYGVQSLLANEVTTRPRYPRSRRAGRGSAQGGRTGCCRRRTGQSYSLPAEPAVGVEREEELDEGEFTDVELKPADFPAEGAGPAATISPPPGVEEAEQSQEGHQAQQDQVEEEVGAGDAAPAEAEQQEETEEEIVADFALATEGAAGGAPEEFPLTTADSPEAEVPPDNYEQDLGQVPPSPEPACSRRRRRGGHCSS